jgi:hypothetical protein
MSAAPIILAAWAVGWIAARLVLARYGRAADTRRSRLALHIFLLFHEPIHALVCTKRHLDGILRECRTRKGLKRRVKVD